MIAVDFITSQYTLQANGVNQNVSTSENSVIFHVTRSNVDAWIVQDFDTVRTCMIM